MPIVVPGWLENLPGRRSRRQSAEQGPINMKSILRPFSPTESWDDEGLPKIPQHEILANPDEELEEQPSFRTRSNTIGNGQIPRLARKNTEEKEIAKKDNVKVS